MLVDRHLDALAFVVVLLRVVVTTALVLRRPIRRAGFIVALIVILGVVETVLPVVTFSYRVGEVIEARRRITVAGDLHVGTEGVERFGIEEAHAGAAFVLAGSQIGIRP